MEVRGFDARIYLYDSAHPRFQIITWIIMMTHNIINMGRKDHTTLALKNQTKATGAYFPVPGYFLKAAHAQQWLIDC